MMHLSFRVYNVKILTEVERDSWAYFEKKNLITSVFFSSIPSIPFIVSIPINPTFNRTSMCLLSHKNKKALLSKLTAPLEG